MFQSGNLLYTLWLAYATSSMTGFPWSAMLAMEALVWVSTAPFYTQSNTIAALPRHTLRRLGLAITGAKVSIAAVVFLTWWRTQDPSTEIALAGLACFLGAALLPQWLLFRDRFSEYAGALLLSRLLFAAAMHARVLALEDLLFLYSLQYVVPPLVVIVLNRSRTQMKGEVPGYDLRSGFANSSAYTLRYSSAAFAASACFTLAPESTLWIITLCDRALRPVALAITPYLLRISPAMENNGLRRTSVALAVCAAAIAASGAMTQAVILFAYFGLLSLEVSAALHFVGVRPYRRSLGLTCALASLGLSLGVSVTAETENTLIYAIALLALGQVLLSHAEKQSLSQ